MKKLHVLLEQIGGCGDGGCMIHVRPGMHTNGGCRCSTDPLKMRQTVHTYKGAVAEQAQEIERLREAAERALHILQYCPDKQEKAVALLSAALQPKEGEG